MTRLGKRMLRILFLSVVMLWMSVFSSFGMCCISPARISYESGINSGGEDIGYGETDDYTSALDAYDFGEIQDFINNNQGTSGFQISFKELMLDLLAGRFTKVMTRVGNAVKDSLFSEIGSSSHMMAQIVILGLIGAVFTSFSKVFTSSQISETGFFVTYLLLFTYLAASFYTNITLAGEITEQILGFMRALVPAYFLAAAFAGGSVSAMASYEFTLFTISAVQGILFYLLLPLVKVYILLVLAGHIAKEDILSKMTDLLSGCITWVLKTLLGVVLGFHLLQGLVLPYVDSMKSGLVQKLIGAIPGIGGGASAVTQMVLGSGVLIKNTIGAAAVVILLIMAVIPVMKLVIVMVLYQIVAAILQPVCDKRIVSCISDTAQGHKLLLGIVMSSVLLFVITIAVVCASSNVSYYSG